MCGELIINGTSIQQQSETVVKDDYQLVVWASIDACLVLIILGGNILTISALKLSRKLWSVLSNHFVCSLAFSDLLVGLMLPYHLSFYIVDSLGTNKWTCLLRFVMIVFACCASIYNLLAIATDRYIAIMYPLHYNRFMTTRKVNMIIAGGWIMSVVLASMPIYWNCWDSCQNIQTCEIFNIIPRNYISYVLAPFYTSFWIGMFVVYVRIWMETKEHAKRMRNSQYYNNGHNNDWKSVQVVLPILGSFSISWIPYLIVTLLMKYKYISSIHIYEAAFTLAMANSGINPIIYAWKNSGYRSAFISLLQCRSLNHNNNENNFIASNGEQPNLPMNNTNNGPIVKTEVELEVDNNNDIKK